MEKSHWNLTLIFWVIYFWIVSFTSKLWGHYKTKIAKILWEFLTKAEKFQWNEYAQSLFDEAIKLCPNNDYAYRENSSF